VVTSRPPLELTWDVSLSLSLDSAVLQSYFHHDGAGFMSIHLGKDVMNATFYDSNGTQLYTAQSTRKYAPLFIALSLSLSLSVES
jgi:hypothetical protein